MLMVIFCSIVVWIIVFKVARLRRRMFPLAHKYFGDHLDTLEALCTWQSILASIGAALVLLIDAGYPGFIGLVTSAVVIHVCTLICDVHYERRGRKIENTPKSRAQWIRDPSRMP